MRREWWVALLCTWFLPTPGITADGAAAVDNKRLQNADREP